MYIDPGSGSMVLQLLLSMAVGAAFTFRRALARVGGLFRLHRPSGDDPASPAVLEKDDGSISSESEIRPSK
jgi:hypothetical protein